MAQALQRSAVTHGFVFAPGSTGPWGMQGVIKRCLDMVAAGLALVLLGFPMLVVALLIKLDSPGPALIAQERVGRDMRRFRMYKFRSMVANAGELQQDLMRLNEASGPLFKIKRDPRLTRVGKLIRRTSLDETPQLLNVLLGDMSLVGPRPPFPHEVMHDYFRQTLRLRSVPGMTGLWQVSGRSDLHYEQMIRLDLRYTRDWTLWKDLEILARTPVAVVTGRGAH